MFSWCSVDPYRMPHIWCLIWVYAVFPGLSVPILKVLTGIQVRLLWNIFVTVNDSSTLKLESLMTHWLDHVSINLYAKNYQTFQMIKCWSRLLVHHKRTDGLIIGHSSKVDLWFIEFPTGHSINLMFTMLFPFIYAPRRAKMCGLTSSCACAKSHPGICSPLKHSIVANKCVCRQYRPWSDCAEAQANLVLRCPHMPEVFAWHSHIFYNSLFISFFFFFFFFFFGFGFGLA